MPIQEMQNNPGSDQTEKPVDGQGPVIDDQVDDDLGNRYLLGRQVAHEYYSPAVQRLLEVTASDPTATTTESQPKEKEPTQWEKRLAKGPTQVPPAESDTLIDPFLDPMTAGSGAFGAVGKLSLSAGMKLMPSLGRAISAGVIGAGADYPIGVATEGLEEVAPGAALPFNILVGMVSGATIELALEEAVMQYAPRAFKGAQSLMKEMTTGVAKTEVAQKATAKLAEAFDIAKASLSMERADADVKIKATDPETGEVFESAMKADEALADTARREDTYTKMMECLAQ
jgi:hypothetical protein